MASTTGRRTQLTAEQASGFYWDSYEMDWFSEAVSHLYSGPVFAICVSGPGDTVVWGCAIDHLKSVVGPATYEKRSMYPQCLRSQFGTTYSDVKNAVHASANESLALRELKFFFPELIVEPVLIDNLASYYLNQNVHPVLTVGLSKLVRERPQDPLLWLADWLLANNPNKPRSLSSDTC